ncbi:MAG TPA: PKD domain-containing protein, partial [Thermoplasmatales archaeon]|nr:PKD domain-containing protein [Thermoplasmatales archaeon]
MKMSMKKLITIVVAVLITSSAISIFVTFGYTELKESGEKLLVGIKTDRAPVGIEPFSLNLSANVINAKGKIRYRWDLGNGKTAEGKEVMVTYDESGIYNVTLIVYDETGRKTSDYLKVEVKENRPPIVTLIIDKKNVERKRTWLSYFTFSPPLWYAGNQQLQLDRIEKKKGPWAWGESGITITAQINDPEGDEIVSYEWEEQTADELVIWPSGKTILPKHNLTGNETVKIPSLYAWIAGRHIVTLTVKDSVGNEATGTTDYMVSMSQMEMRMKTIPTTFTVVTTISETIAKILEIGGGTLWNRLPEDQKEQIFYRLDTVYEKINTNPTLKNLPLIQSVFSRLLGLIPSI